MPWIHKIAKEFWIGKRTPIYIEHGTEKVAK